MAGTVDLPAIGRVKTGYVWGGAAVVAVIVGYAYIRHRNSASSSSASSAGTAATGATDPATGYPEGSPEDLAALQAQSGGAYNGAGGGYAGYGSGYSGQNYYYDPADGLYDLTSPYTGSTGSANTGPGTFTDNAYWVQYAIEQVQGYTAEQVQGALSAYLSGLGLTTTQMSIYQASIAVAGQPPHPPSSPAHLQNGTGNGSSSPQVTVPNVAGVDVEQATQILTAAGLKVHGPAGVPHKLHIVTGTSPAAGKKADPGTTVTLSYKTVSELQPKK